MRPQRTEAQTRQGVWPSLGTPHTGGGPHAARTYRDRIDRALQRRVGIGGGDEGSDKRPSQKGEKSGEIGHGERERREFVNCGPARDPVQGFVRRRVGAQGEWREERRSVLARLFPIGAVLLERSISKAKVFHPAASAPRIGASLVPPLLARVALGSHDNHQ